MQGFGTEKNNILINFTLRVIPLFTLLATWRNDGTKLVIGDIYLGSNKIAAVLGFLIIFGIAFLKINSNFKLIANALGNLIFWIPPFYAAIGTEPNMFYLTGGYWVSIIIVFVCFILQSVMIYKEKPIEK